jgi:hypothetical protein
VSLRGPEAWSDSREIESVFRTLVDKKADALLVGPDAFYPVVQQSLPSVGIARGSRGN